MPPTRNRGAASAPGSCRSSSRSGRDAPGSPSPRSPAGRACPRDALTERGLERFTPQTVNDPAQLRRELGDCRRTGPAIVREERTAGGESVATRIMNGEGRVVAALSVVVRSGSVSLTAAVPSVVTSGLGNVTEPAIPLARPWPTTPCLVGRNAW